MSFLKLTGDERLDFKEAFHSFPGLSAEEQALKRIAYGFNEILVPLNSIFKLILLEVLNPFYFFQLFTIVVWLLDNYIYYCFAVVCMSVFGISSSVIQTHKNERNLQKTTHSQETVKVRRKGKIYEDCSSSHLVPGDVIVIPPHGCVMQCDAVLLEGNCIVNESMLTGESVPVIKTALPKSQEAFSVRDDTNHILFCGTHVLQSRFYNNEKIHAVVLRTGFSTSKGSLVRAILFPPPADFKFDQDSYKFVFILAAIGVSSFFYSLIIKVKLGAETFETIIKSLDLLTIAIPAALPAAMTVGKIYALKRLKAQKVSCINSRVINVSGSLNCVCFDKTGTLTEDGLDMWGVIPISQASYSGPSRDVHSLPPGPLLFGMATCHSLTIIDGKIAGDPLDEKMFEATNWVLQEPTVPDCSKYDLLVPTIVKPALGEEIEFGILHQYQFSSNLQRMSVIVRELHTQELTVFCKGSPEMIMSLSTPSTVPPDSLSVLKKYTEKGYRVLALGWKNLPNTPFHLLEKLKREDIERDLTFCGLVVLENRVKPETKPTIDDLKAADIKVVMITGDNIQTAMSVARESGIIEQYEIFVEAVCSMDESSGSPTISFYNHDDMKFMSEKRGELTPDNIKNRLNVKLATSGKDWAVIKETFPHFIPLLLAKGVVFARMTSDQKQQVIIELQKLMGLSVAMCGDGANDCGALKAANVGISLSDSEASVASPFTSQEQNIKCVVKVIREGRAALTTSFGVFKFMVLYSLAQLISTLILYNVGSNLTDFQFLFIDVVLIVNFAFFFGQNEAYKGPLVSQIPLQSVLGVCPIASIILQSVVLYLFQTMSLSVVRHFPWFTPHKYTLEDDENLRSYENYAIYTVSQFQYIIMTICFSQGPPYRTPIYKNTNLLISLIATTVLCVLVTLLKIDWVAEFFELQYPPDMDFRLVVIVLALANFLVCLFFEMFVIEFLLFKKYLRRKSKIMSDSKSLSWRRTEVPTESIIGDCVQVFKNLKN